MAISEKYCFAGPIRILVVDDFRPFREILHQQSAIEIAFRLAPQVITMDMQMLRFGGVEATSRIKKALP